MKTKELINWLNETLDDYSGYSLSEVSSFAHEIIQRLLEYEELKKLMGEITDSLLEFYGYILVNFKKD